MKLSAFSTMVALAITTAALPAPPLTRVPALSTVVKNATTTTTTTITVTPSVKVVTYHPGAQTIPAAPSTTTFPPPVPSYFYPNNSSSPVIINRRSDASLSNKLPMVVPGSDVPEEKDSAANPYPNSFTGPAAAKPEVHAARPPCSPAHPCNPRDDIRAVGHNGTYTTYITINLDRHVPTTLATTTTTTTFLTTPTTTTTTTTTFLATTPTALATTTTTITSSTTTTLLLPTPTPTCTKTLNTFLALSLPHAPTHYATTLTSTSLINCSGCAIAIKTVGLGHGPMIPEGGELGRIKGAGTGMEATTVTKDVTTTVVLGCSKDVATEFVAGRSALDWDGEATGAWSTVWGRGIGEAMVTARPTGLYGGGIVEG